MEEPLTENITAMKETGLNQCQQLAETQAYTTGLENASQQFNEIIITMFIANFLMIFTGRLLRRENPYKITILGKDLYQLPHLNIEDKWIEKIDGALFSLNFTLVSFLIALNTIGYGKFTTGGL